MKNYYNRGKHCKADGCSRGARCKGYCMFHYCKLVIKDGRPSVSAE